MAQGKQRADGIQEISVPFDNYGRLYIAVLESDLSSMAKLCYGVMWSFGGQRNWASASSIARRMGVHRNTVGPAQRELEVAGWIVLIETQKGMPVKWQMKTPSTNIRIPAQPLGTPLAQQLGTPSTTIGHLPAQPLGSKQEGNQEGKKEREASPPTPSAEAILQALSAPYARKYTHALTDTPENRRDALKAHQALGEDLMPTWENYLADNGTVSPRSSEKGILFDTAHPLSPKWFKYDTYRARPKASAMPPAPESRNAGALSAEELSIIENGPYGKKGKTTNGETHA